MNEMLRDRVTLMAALGAGVVVGLSGIYMYYKRSTAVAQEIKLLKNKIDLLKFEVDELKQSSITVATVTTSSSKSRSMKSAASKRHKNNGTKSTLEAPKNDVADADSSLEDEFFDFTSSDEGGTESDSYLTLNGPHSVLSQDSAKSDASYLDELDILLDGSTEEKRKAFDLLQERATEIDGRSDYLWRLAKASHFCKLTAQKEGNVVRQRDLSYEAYKAASKALELTKEDPEVHKWYAITIGALGEYVSIQEKVKNGIIFKEHVETAVALKPFDPTLHHLLGRWCYEVANLSWLERKAASLIFSEPPTATLDEAIEHLTEADRLLPNWKENILLLSKSYINDGNYSTAIQWINQGLKSDSKGEDDEIAHSELEMLQNKYQSYSS